MSLGKIQELRKLINELDQEISEFVSSSPSAEEAGEELSELNFLKRDMSIVYDTFAGALSEMMGNIDHLTLSNGAVIEKKSSYDRKGWRHAEIASVVAQRIVQTSVDMDTGEVMKSPEEMAAEMLQYCAPSYWRVKECNKLNINLDNFCDVGELKTSIIVRKPKN
jgi:hypothetical protein